MTKRNVSSRRSTSVRSRAPMSREEAGRLGAEARWGKPSSRGASPKRTSRNLKSRTNAKEMYDEVHSSYQRRPSQSRITSTSRSASPSRITSTSRTNRSEAGRRGAEARFGVRSPESRIGKRTTSTISRSEAGRRGAEARWGIASSKPSNHHTSRRTSTTHSISRSEAGRRGAEARWGNTRERQLESIYGTHSRGETSRRGTESRRTRGNERDYHEQETYGLANRGQRAGRPGHYFDEERVHPANDRYARFHQGRGDIENEYEDVDFGIYAEEPEYETPKFRTRSNSPKRRELSRR